MIIRETRFEVFPGHAVLFEPSQYVQQTNNGFLLADPHDIPPPQHAMRRANF